MQLAVFDLDHTLLPLDTGEVWVRWLLAASGRDPAPVVRETERFTREYRAGVIDIDEFMAFQLGFLAGFERAFLDRCLAEYIERVVRPAVPEASRRLVEEHRREGHYTALCTATYSFVTRPVAALFGIDTVLASRPLENPDGSFTGTMQGPASFAQGKVEFVKNLLAERGLERPEAMWFYSDSCADLPLFELCASWGGVNTAVNAEPALEAIARRRGWREMRTFDAQDLARVDALRESLVRPRGN